MLLGIMMQRALANEPIFARVIVVVKRKSGPVGLWDDIAYIVIVKARRISRYSQPRARFYRFYGESSASLVCVCVWWMYTLMKCRLQRLAVAIRSKMKVTHVA